MNEEEFREMADAEAYKGTRWWAAERPRKTGGEREGVRETRLGLGGPGWTVAVAVALTLTRLWRVRPAHAPHTPGLQQGCFSLVCTWRLCYAAAMQDNY